MAGNAAQALYTAAGRILSFASTFPSQGGNNSLYNNGEGVMIGGVGNDVLESGAGSNVMFGDNGRVTFVNDRFSVAETLDIAYGGDDILLAGTGGNFMLGGRGSDMFRGSFSKDVMVGDFAAIYFDLSGSRVVNLTRFGPGGNSPDLITRSLEALYSWPGTRGMRRIRFSNAPGRNAAWPSCPPATPRRMAAASAWRRSVRISSSNATMAAFRSMLPAMPRLA